MKRFILRCVQYKTVFKELSYVVKMALTERHTSLLMLFIGLMCFQRVFGNFDIHKLGAQARSLLFPVTAPTRIQFIGGIGIPVEDLRYESVTSGYVLKAEYFLPIEVNDFRTNRLKPQPIQRRSIDASATQHEYSQQRQHNSSSNIITDNVDHTTPDANFKSQQKNASAYRWIIYKSIEILLDRAGQPGRVCLLRSICEHAALPLNYESGMLAEILHIVLTPSTSHDELMKPSNAEYLAAEMVGHTGANCADEFSECAQSPIDQISTILHLTDIL